MGLHAIPNRPAWSGQESTIMNTRSWIVVAVCLVAGPARADSTPSPETIMAHFLEWDPFGLSGASVSARAILTDKSGAKSELAFSERSKRLGPGIAESLVRFTAPPDLAGAGFLQIQKNDGDDDRSLYLPDLKRSRRISGSLRASAFMGTDLSYADLDRRDLRDSTATLTGSETIGKYDCFVVDAVPKRADSQYSHAELWIRKDNYVPLQMKFYDHSKTLLKVFTAFEVKRVSGQWFVSRSRMTNVQQNHTTDLTLEQISTTDPIADDEFTVRALEKSQ
jgi:outer membrane lipoprotein-sorting protein